MLLDEGYRCAECHRPVRVDRLRECGRCGRFICPQCTADAYHMLAHTRRICRQCARRNRHARR